MTTARGRSAGPGLWALALTMALAADALAQTGGVARIESGAGSSADRRVQAAAAADSVGVKPAVAGNAAPRPNAGGAEDMRLWSFGDCERRFPYVNSADHKECVRVVGSAEARDARAYRVCEVSHEKDREEIERCKEAYQVNKVKAAEDGVTPNSPAHALAPPSPEVMQRVKAIASAAVERDRAAALASAPPADAAEPAAEENVAQPELSWSMSTIGMVSLGLLVLGLGATLARRKLAGSAS